MAKIYYSSPKKTGLIILIFICGFLLFVGIRSNDKKETGAPSVPKLDLKQDFEEKTLYRTAECTGKITANCTPVSLTVSKETAHLKVELTNHGPAVTWSSLKEEQLEKRIDGEWYSAKSDQPGEAKEITGPVFDEGDTLIYSYQIPKASPPGTYRILYLFTTDWCSVEFTIK